MKKWMLIAVLALFGAAAVCASPAPVPDKSQKKEKVKNITVSGTVKDEAGKPLADVSVMVIEVDTGTVTDASGEFRGIFPNNAVLEFSLKGYEIQKVNVDGRYEINVVLKKELKKEVDQ